MLMESVAGSPWCAQKCQSAFKRDPFLGFIGVE